ncbi:MAG: TraR/DksA C4-type zinc finger protein [Verrucomicrobiota bacterium]
MILGAAKNGPAIPKIDKRWLPFYRRLLKLRDYFLDQQHDLTMKAREIEPHYLQREPADVAEADFERDFDLGKVSADQELLNEIDAALDRIELGTYGICEQTGKPIPKDRLEAVPWTRFTVEAEREIESRHGGIRPSLGPLRPLRRESEESGELEMRSKPETEEAEEPRE